MTAKAEPPHYKGSRRIGGGGFAGLDGGFGGGGAAWACGVGWRGGAGGGGVFWGRDEEIAGGLEEVEPEGADEVAVVAAADVLRAQGEAQREIETGGEIQHEGASDPEGGHEQRTRANSGEPQRSGAEREHAGRKRDVANVERQAEKFPENRSHAQHETEDDGAAPSRDIAREGIGDARESFGFEFFAEAMLGDCFRQAVIDRPVFDPAAGDTGKPQDYAGKSRVENGSAVKRVQRSDGVPGRFIGKEGVADETVPEHHQNQRAGTDRDDIPEGGGELGAENPGDILEQIVIARGAAAILNDAGESGPGHGRLLGGEREMIVLHQDETDGVIEADQKSFEEEGQVPVSGNQFDGGSADGEQAATESRTPHLQIFRAIVGDVVLAGFARPFDNFSRQ